MQASRGGARTTQAPVNSHNAAPNAQNEHNDGPGSLAASWGQVKIHLWSGLGFLMTRKRLVVFYLLVGFIIGRMLYVAISQNNMRLLAFTLFLVAVAIFIWYRQRKRRQSHVLHLRSQAMAIHMQQARNSAARPHGVSEQTKTKFKYFEFSSESQSLDVSGARPSWMQDLKDCPICLGDYQTGERLCALAPCRHVFHAGCIDEWLKSHQECPNCKVNLDHPGGEQDIEAAQSSVPIVEDEISIAIQRSMEEANRGEETKNA